MPAPPTRWAGRSCPISRATRCWPTASRMASPATSFRGTIRCRFSAARWVRRLPRAMPAWSSRPKTPAFRCCAWPSLLADAGFPRRAQYRDRARTRGGRGAGAHPGIDHVSFTGSPPTGTPVAQAAAGNHVPVTLELGGKSPQLVFADADLDAALPVVINAIVQNAGQTCSAGSRLLMQRAPTSRCSSAGRALSRLARRAGAADLACGPLIRASQLAHVRQMVHEAREAAFAVAAHGQFVARRAPWRLLLRADRVPRRPPAHRLAQDEVFGPVLAAMASTRKTRALAWPTARVRPGRGRLDARHLACDARCQRCAAARCSSMTTVPAAVWDCPSAV